MTEKVRAYRMRRRAESQQQTRLRITESAVELHGTVGPSKTSISAVAALADVRRSTVYRHFPDEAALFQACTTHWAAANPPPDVGAWATIDDVDERLGLALGEFYAFYRRTEPMLENVFRDEAIVSIVREHLTIFLAYITTARDTLMVGRGLRGAARRRTRAALGHALSFSTWKSLVREQDLSDTDAAALMCTLVAAASFRATPRARATGRAAPPAPSGRA